MNINEELIVRFNENFFRVLNCETQPDGKTVLEVEGPSRLNLHYSFELKNATYRELIDCVIKEIGNVSFMTGAGAEKAELLTSLFGSLKFAFENTLDKSIQDFSFAENSENTVKSWYCAAFPADSLGETLKDVTFEDVYKSFGEFELRDVIGTGDATITERLLDKLEEITGLDYNTLRDAWVNQKHLPDIDSLEVGKNSLNPPLFELREPEMGYSKSRKLGYVEYAAEFCDNEKFYRRAGFGNPDYPRYSDVKEAYPEAYCNVYVTVYENNQVEYSMTIVDGYLDEEEREPYKDVYLTPNEQALFFDAVCEALEKTGESITEHLKLAKEARLELSNKER